MLEDCQRRYGDMFTLRIAHEGTWVFLADPDAIKQVFTGDPRVLHAGEANVVLLPVLGHHSVLLLDEAAHMSQRKLMLPPFHGERMRGYEQTMAEVAADGDRELAGGRAATRCARAMQADHARGDHARRSSACEDDAAARARCARRSRTRSSGARARAAWRCWPCSARSASAALRAASSACCEPADELIYEEIRARREAPDLEERDDILSLLLQARHEDGSPMTDKELRDELMTLLVAGHETTATSLAWAVERSVRTPGVLERLREEALPATTSTSTPSARRRCACARSCRSCCAA